MSVHELKVEAVDLQDEFDTKLRDLAVIADLIAAAESDRIEVDRLNDAGYLMGRMFEDVQKLKAEIRKQAAKP
jgi:hypothetical protein